MSAVTPFCIVWLVWGGSLTYTFEYLMFNINKITTKSPQSNHATDKSYQQNHGKINPMKWRICKRRIIEISLYKKLYNKLIISLIYYQYILNLYYDMRSVGVCWCEDAYRFVLTYKIYLKIQFNINNLKYWIIAINKLKLKCKYY